jgi:hypothetical protein
VPCRAIWIRWLNHQCNRLLAGSVHKQYLEGLCKSRVCERDHSPNRRRQLCRLMNLLPLITQWSFPRFRKAVLARDGFEKEGPGVS